MKFPLARYKVYGDSMVPTLKEGHEVICYKWAFSKDKMPKVGDIVVAKIKDLEIVKRVIFVREDTVYLRGDNETDSTDSRNFGWISLRQIVGKAIWMFR